MWPLSEVSHESSDELRLYSLAPLLREFAATNPFGQLTLVIDEDGEGYSVIRLIQEARSELENPRS